MPEFLNDNFFITFNITKNIYLQENHILNTKTILNFILKFLKDSGSLWEPNRHRIDKVRYLVTRSLSDYEI